MPLSWPSAFSRVSSAAGERRSPLMPTASPRSNSTVISVARSGASSGRMVRCQTISSGASQGSSRIFPSEEECSRLASTREGRLAALVLGDRDLVLLGEGDQRGAAGQVPFPPGGDHLHVRLQGVIGQLEAHLVVALAGRAMGHGVGADLPRRSRSAAWRSAAGRWRCRAGTGPRTARWRGTSGRRSRGRIPPAGRRRRCSPRVMPSSRALSRAGPSSSPWPRSAVKVTTSQR